MKSTKIWRCPGLPNSGFLLSLVVSLQLLSFFAWCSIATTGNEAELKRPPNFVILFADNLGYYDVGTFASDYNPDRPSRTPNIDGMADAGLKFTNWNSAAHLCSASRASLLTGKYPVRSGVYPAVFEPDAKYGLPPTERTMAQYLKDEHGYRTSIVGKWHLGSSRKEYLPTNFGFDEWLGVPYHMSGGSLDNHTCYFDDTETMWLPLMENERIVEQPLQVGEIASKFAEQSRAFIGRGVAANDSRPFFLYMAFSHVHQLCAPRDLPEQRYCQWGRKTHSYSSASFGESLEEMDWIAGEVLRALDDFGVSNDTLVLFTSDNGPWVAEQSCSGLKGPFEGRWLRDNVSKNCTACPHGGYVPNYVVEDRPRLCVLPGTNLTLDGVHCGEDSGLGSVWEANLRMPALARWPGKIEAMTVTSELVSTLDVLPTFLSIVGSHRNATAVNYTATNTADERISKLDGIDISPVLFGKSKSECNQGDERILFFWRDGFSSGPLPAPFGREDVAAVKVGRIKVWFYTKSAHFNNDTEVYHDPPLLFDTISDPAEAHPLPPHLYRQVIQMAKRATREHKAGINWTHPGPLTLERDPKYLPCANRDTGCRTDREPPLATDATKTKTER